MNGKPRRPDISPALVCPYCRGTPEFLPSSEVLYRGRDYGPAYVCLPCQAWVGCHPGTTEPLGRLADAALRKAKIAAHAAFDRTWRDLHARRRASEPACTPRHARARQYRRLAELLRIPPRDCHIGLFDVETCLRVVQLCTEGALGGD